MAAREEGKEDVAAKILANLKESRTGLFDRG
jgi:hypothetical protein